MSQSEEKNDAFACDSRSWEDNCIEVVQDV